MIERVYRRVGCLYCDMFLFVAALVPTERGRNSGNYRCDRTPRVGESTQEYGSAWEIAGLGRPQMVADRLTSCSLMTTDMKAPRDQFEIRKQLATYGDDQVIDAVELAAFRCISVKMLYRLLYLRSDAIPPPLDGFGRKRLWRMGNCREWLRTRESTPRVSSPRPSDNEARAGRPRKL